MEEKKEVFINKNEKNKLELERKLETNNNATIEQLNNINKKVQCIDTELYNAIVKIEELKSSLSYTNDKIFDLDNKEFLDKADSDEKIGSLRDTLMPRIKNLEEELKVMMLIFVAAFVIIMINAIYIIINCNK